MTNNLLNDLLNEALEERLRRSRLLFLNSLESSLNSLFEANLTKDELREQIFKIITDSKLSQFRNY